MVKMEEGMAYRRTQRRGQPQGDVGLAQPVRGPAKRLSKRCCHTSKEDLQEIFR